MPEVPDQNALGSLQPEDCNAALVLDDGTVFWGWGAGATGLSADDTTGEVCFNTALTGYQEILTDPSYAGQIITFTFPHIGNVGTNEEDVETVTPAVKGCVLSADITEPANWRAAKHLDTWLAAHDIAAVTGIDTRRLTRRIRDKGFANGIIIYPGTGTIDLPAAVKHAQAWPNVEGQDLAKEVTCTQTYPWTESAWAIGEGYGTLSEPRRHVVALDFGAKHNILRCLAAAGCNVTVVPASTSADDILAHNPDGIFLSNGPGDPAATGAYAVPTIQALVESGKPVFGICLGHQMLA
ncbi:MAG: carbamoyl phosphate synthase small subunit, partial [Rhodospirillales bacterium]|nr:carbamoyl phosphate synthase small subunit [Rhodospirillales bacterium]